MAKYCPTCKSVHPVFINVVPGQFDAAPPAAATATQARRLLLGTTTTVGAQQYSGNVATLLNFGQPSGNSVVLSEVFKSMLEPTYAGSVPTAEGTDAFVSGIQVCLRIAHPNLASHWLENMFV